MKNQTNNKKTATKKNSSTKSPAFQFYVMDWLTDSELRCCSHVARAIWVDILCHMHLSRMRGKLVINDQPMTMPQIQNMLHLSDSVFETAFTELIRNHVIRMDEQGYFYSKRMVEDEKLRQTRAACGALGGNPNLGKPGEISLTKTEAKGQPKRKQNPTPSSSSSSSSSNSNTFNKLNVYAHPVCDLIKSEFPNIGNIKNQMTAEQAEKLVEDFGMDKVHEILQQMENKRDLTRKYQSVYLTALNWLKTATNGKSTNNNQQQNRHSNQGGPGKPDHAAAIREF